MHVAVVGGSDAGIEAARRCRQLDPSVEVTVLVADAYPNLSICGLPYWHSRLVPRWQDLAHRTVADLEATGMRLLLNHRVTSLDLDTMTLRFCHGGAAGELGFDRLVLGTGAHPVRPPIDGLAALGRDDRVHVLHRRERSGSTRSPSSSPQMTTIATTPGRPSCGSGLPATGPPGGYSAASCWVPTAPRSPSGPTYSRPRSPTATPSLNWATWTCPTRHR